MADQLISPTPSKRITVVDGLRGFALLTVLLTHFITAFSGYPDLFLESQLATLPFPELDGYISKISLLLFKLKSRLLFSFLFGLGFYFQIKKAERLGTSFHKTFIKRLVVMLVIGLVHAYLILWGDILRWYFVAGLFLLVLYKLNSRTILAISFVLAFIIPATESILDMVLSHNIPGKLTVQQIQAAFLSGSYLETIKMNAAIEHLHYANPWYFVGYVSNILGFFFLGLWAGKVDLFQKIEDYLPKIRRGLIIGALIFLAGSFMYLFSPFPKNESPVAYQIVHSLGYRMNAVGLFTVYLCGFILLYRLATYRYYLEVFVPVGKMTLTNYILQSVAAVFLFNGLGLGLLGKIGPSLILPIALAFFALQIILSHLWLRYFLSGPLEWIWRMAVSGKRQPILRTDQLVAN